MSDLQPSDKIWKELVEAAGTDPKPGEEAEDFTERVLKKIDKLPDGDYDSLSGAAQNWANEYQEIINQNEDARKEAKKNGDPDPEIQEIPLLLIPDEAQEQEEASEPEDAESEQETELKANTKEKEKPVAKTVRGKVKEKPPVTRVKAAQGRVVAKAKNGDDTSNKPRSSRKKNESGQTKTALVASLLLRKNGCTRADILSACDWPAVSVQAMAKAADLKLRKEKDGRVTRYYGTQK